MRAGRWWSWGLISRKWFFFLFVVCLFNVYFFALFYAALGCRSLGDGSARLRLSSMRVRLKLLLMYVAGCVSCCCCLELTSGFVSIVKCNIRTLSPISSL
jgi:hypothetical protein